MKPPLQFRLVLTLCAFTFAFAPVPASAGINLAWDDCGPSGSLQKNFACDTNLGVNTLYGSGITDVDVPQLNGQASIIDMQTNQATLSPWWRIGVSSGDCRPMASMTPNFNFLTNSSCVDPWQGLADGGLSYAMDFGGPNFARIRTVCAIPGTTSIDGTVEHYFFKVAITNEKTVGSGACDGCTDGVCFVLLSIKVTQPVGVGDYVLTNPMIRQHALWQPGGASVPGAAGRGPGCPGATPAQTATWGWVKSLYR